MGASKTSCPAKRSLPPPPKAQKKEVKKGVGLWHCSKCLHKGVEVYENVYLCNKGVNAPHGNHSIIDCVYFS